MGALGGQLQQLYYVVNAIFTLFPNDDLLLKDYYTKMSEDPKNDALKNPSQPRELLLENFFLPWIMTAIKELKCDHLQFLIPPQLEALIATFKLPKNNEGILDFTKLNMEQYLAFRHAFVEERMFNETYKANTGQRAITLILDSVCMILCNRVPKGVVQFRPDSIINKIRLVGPPRGVEIVDRTQVEKVSISDEFPTGEKHTLIEKNTNEKAVVRIMVPKRTMTMSEVNAENTKPEENEDPTSPKSSKSIDEEKKGDKTPEPTSPTPAKEEEASQQHPSRLSRVPSERIIEQDQDDRALIIANRINLQTPYMVLVMNQYAARAHRADFID